MYRASAASIFALMLILIVCCSPSAAEGKRVALVIGNAGYQHASDLRNPRNDAQDVGAALKKVGFTVIYGFDLGQIEMGRIIQDFASALDGAAVGVFFYAGHGIQINGVNYLVPVDSRMDSEHSPDFELIRIDLVQRVMESRRRTNILFLDACRDNPLARNLARAMGTRSASIGRGLAATESGIGTLVSFSTQPGNVALDGAGRNSPYARALALHLAREGSDIADMLINIRRDVIKSTNYRQVPWEHSALTDRFYFSAPTGVQTTSLSPLPPLPPESVAPGEEADLARRINRELRRVGCNPGQSDGQWTKESRSAMERFASATKQAVHSDQPTLAALHVLERHTMRVCSLPTVAPPKAQKTNSTAPHAPPTGRGKHNCRLEKWSECNTRIGHRKGGGSRGCSAKERRMICSD